MDFRKILSVTFAMAMVMAMVIGIGGCRLDQQQAEAVEESLFDNYVGSERCGSCHSGIYAKFVNSGHRHKLRKVENGQKPEYPFTELPDIPGFGLRDGDNTLGPPGSYNDVSYVIGGFKWKARFVDRDGYIITGSDTQYNLENDSWVAYSDGSVDKPYDCGRCHATGWVPFDEGGVRQDGMPGMEGAFFAGGIHCEECHGPGAAHVNTHGDPGYITTDTTSEFCGRCHTRDSQRRIAASGGLIRHHEQYDELLGVNPDNPGAGGTGGHLANGVGCNTCHDPHATTAKQDYSGEPGVIRDCVECHADKAITTGPHREENLLAEGLLKPSGKRIPFCISCHMPKMVKSAVSQGPVGTGPKIGDIKSHIFKIDLTTTRQFTDDGSFSYPWITGQFACKKCHNGEHFSNVNFPRTRTIHTYDQ